MADMDVFTFHQWGRKTSVPHKTGAFICSFVECAVLAMVLCTIKNS